ncbi:helix-turn-helix domain-containing protein [Streptomyces sp. NBC_00016]
MTTKQVKRAFKYRFCPTDAQAAELSRTFGCMRKVYNLALDARTRAWARQERINYNQTSAMLTAWKRTQELAYLGEVSSVPLQQTLRHLQVAFTNFFGRQAQYPRFKSKKKSRRSAEYTTSGFRFREGRLTLAKMADPLTCECGAVHDRDVNAANNLLAAGLAVSVWGAGVRPQRESSRTGQSAMKQKPPRREP